jgi:hypothetical protein
MDLANKSLEKHENEPEYGEHIMLQRLELIEYLTNASLDADKMLLLGK